PPYCHSRRLHSFPTRRSSDLELADYPAPAPRLRSLPTSATGVSPHRFVGSSRRSTVSSSRRSIALTGLLVALLLGACAPGARMLDRKSTRLNSSHVKISYAVF